MHRNYRGAPRQVGRRPLAAFLVEATRACIERRKSNLHAVPDGSEGHGVSRQKERLTSVKSVRRLRGFLGAHSPQDEFFPSLADRASLGRFRKSGGSENVVVFEKQVLVKISQIRSLVLGIFLYV